LNARTPERLIMSQRSLFDDNLEPSTEPAPAQDGVAEEVTSPGAGTGTVPAAATILTPEEKAARLEEVRLPALGCTRCGLSRTRTNVVFGEGNAAAPLVLVGEGPGENEDATGRPFVGRAGKLLDEVLRRNGMTRNHVYICNVVKCRAANLENGRWMNRQPTPEEIGACQPWLEEQLGIIKPLVVVCVGAPAANTVIHKGFRITSERGRWFTNSPYAPWAMAVFHPAYILRLNGPAYDAALETLIEDLGQARQKVIEVKRQLKEAAAAAPPPRSLFD
jgi:uracil-DNA glycosylase